MDSKAYGDLGRMLNEDRKCIQCGMYLLDTAWFPDEDGQPVCEICFHRPFQDRIERKHAAHTGSAQIRNTARRGSRRARPLAGEPRTYASGAEEGAQPLGRKSISGGPQAALPGASPCNTESTVVEPVPRELLRATTKVLSPVPVLTVRPPGQSCLNLPRYTFWDEYGRPVAIVVVTVALAAFTYWLTGVL
ncbi:MAG: hypothetical protein M5U26_24695 [Planctomycetota bacterium]|nr:hypothetical protein [Planctomycetota bacterium]